MEPPKKVSIDRLIAIANDAKREMHNSDVANDLNEATKFALAFKIKPGKHKVFGEVIWKAYTMWAFKPTNKVSFFIFFSRMFERKKGKYKHSYFINYQPGELLNEAERMRRNYE